MAFFDDLGKKLSQAGSTAVQKAKDIAEITKTSGLISDEEKKISNAYSEIGKLYVKLHANDVEGDFAALVSAVKEAEGKIEEFKRQIQDIKGVMRCEKCGAEIAVGVAFCSSCGAPAPKPEPPADKKVCPHCGALVDKDMRFCTACGKPIEDEPAKAEPVTEPVNEPKKCPACGAEVAENQAFCTVCGAKID